MDTQPKPIFDAAAMTSMASSMIWVGVRSVGLQKGVRWNPICIGIALQRTGRCVHGLFRRADDDCLAAYLLPAFQQDDALAKAQTEGDLRQRAVALPDPDHHVHGSDEHQVAGLAHTR